MKPLTTEQPVCASPSASAEEQPTQTPLVIQAAASPALSRSQPLEGLARVPQPRPGFELLPQPVPVSLEHTPRRSRLLHRSLPLGTPHSLHGGSM